MEFFRLPVAAVKGLISKVIRYLMSPVILLSKRIILPGFHGVPLYDVGLFFLRGARKSSITLRANAITYSFIIAFVPAIMFLFTLIPYIPVSGLQANIMKSLQEILPAEAYTTVFETIEDIITREQAGLLSISFLITLYFASNGVLAIMNAFNQSSHSMETRTNFKQRLVSLLLVFILAMNIIISAGTFGISSFIFYLMEGQGMISDRFTLFLVNAGQWVMILVTSLIAFSSIFYLAPAKRGIFPFFSAGSVLASVLSVITFKLFIVFIDNFSQHNKFYGSLGTMIVILMWINLTAFMLLIGFELNASIYEAVKNGAGKKDPAETIMKSP